MTNLTALEIKVLKNFTEDEFYEEGFESCIWTESLLRTLKDNEKVDSKIARGTLSSLVKKQLVYMDDETIQLEDPAIEWLKENCSNLDEDGYEIR